MSRNPGEFRDPKPPTYKRLSCNLLCLISYFFRFPFLKHKILLIMAIKMAIMNKNTTWQGGGNNAKAIFYS